MKRFLIHVSTYWCGMDNTFRAEAESELELDEIADQLAYDNFQSYGCEADIAEEEGYDPDEMEDSDWDKLWETVDGDGSIQPNGSSNAFCITITAHESWTQFYQEFMEVLDIPEHISNREGSTTITIRICRREILQLLQDVITNNNLFHLKRKWNKLMIKEPSASES